MRAQSPGLAVWTRWSQATGDNLAWFDHRNGEVVVKNPDDEILTKMVEVATHLQARVQGDEGEWYPAEEARRPWWKRWLG